MTMAEAADFLNMTTPSVHKRLRARGLADKCARSASRVYFGHEVTRGLLDVDWTPITIAWQVVKGGTGKTTLAHEVACCANVHGARVLCVDVDQQANLTTTLGVDMLTTKPMIDIIRGEVELDDAIIPVCPGLDLLGSNMRNAKLDHHIMLEHLPLHALYRDLFKPLQARYDVVIIDCPPALGSSVCAAALAADVVVMPIVPDELSLSGLDVSMDELNTVEERHKCRIRRAIAINRFTNRTILAGEVLHTILADPELKPMLLPTHVRESQDFPNVMAQHKSVFSSLKKSAAKEDITTLTRDLLGLSQRHALRRAG